MGGTCGCIMVDVCYGGHVWLYNGGCVLWGARVVIPKNHRADVLIQLHDGHPGVTRMKGLSRMYVWWPGIMKDVEDTVRDCVEYQHHQAAPAVSPLHPLLGHGPDSILIMPVLSRNT